MSDHLEQIIDEALQLDRPSQLMLAERLLSESIDEPGYEESWTMEIHRRIDEIRDGSVVPQDAFEIIRQTRKELGL